MFGFVDRKLICTLFINAFIKNLPTPTKIAIVFKGKEQVLVRIWRMNLHMLLVGNVKWCSCVGIPFGGSATS